MVKAFVTSTLAWSVLVAGALVAVACSSNNVSTFTGVPADPDAGNVPSGNLVPIDSGRGSSDAGPSSCPPTLPPTFKPTWMAPTKLAACSPADIKAYYDACVPVTGKVDDGSCAKFKAAPATAACGACAEPDDQTGPLQWQLNRNYQTLNTAGCIALVQNALEVGKCGEAYNAAVQCTRKACEYCLTTGGAFSVFQDCQKSATGSGICKSYEAVQGNVCTGYKAANSPALTCFNSGTETQEVHFTRVITTFCGQ